MCVGDKHMSEMSISWTVAMGLIYTAAVLVGFSGLVSLVTLRWDHLWVQYITYIFAAIAAVIVAVLNYRFVRSVRKDADWDAIFP